MTFATTTPYDALTAARSWGEIIWKVDINVKASANHDVTVTIPKAGLYPAHGTDMTKTCSATVDYADCVTGAFPVVEARASLVLTFTKAAGQSVSAQVTVTGMSTGRTVIENKEFTKNFLGKDYYFKGWPDWNTGRDACAAESTGTAMCLTSIHADDEHEAVAGIIATKGYPAAWLGLTDGVGLGRYTDVNDVNWAWSDGADHSYIKPWGAVTPESSSRYHSLDNPADDAGQIHKILATQSTRARANRAVRYAGSVVGGAALTNCGFQLADKSWGSWECGARFPAICAPCGGTKLTKTNLCDECRVPNGNGVGFSDQRCYTEAYCNARRKEHVIPSKDEREVFEGKVIFRDDSIDWGQIVGIIVGVAIGLSCIWWCCFTTKEELLDDEDED